MARKRIRMEKIRNIIRYSMSTDMSERQIARALNVSRTVVSKYAGAFKVSDLELEQIKAMSDSELVARLEGMEKRPKSARYHDLHERFPGFLTMLRKKKGMTLQLLWEDYRTESENGYEYSQFCYHFHRWRKATSVSMHMDHKAGDKMFVDYAGEKLSYTDPVSGKEHPVEVFVAILGASELTYVEATESQKGEDWIRSNERALWYFGGSTQALVPDNIRSAVSRSDRYEPGINPTFDDFAAHYGLVIVPARVRKARDKALVENAVRLVYQRIYARLRGRFTSLGQLNEAIWDLLETHNNRKFQRLPNSRRQLFEEIESPTLRPLPTERYPMKNTHLATVGYNYHVELTDDRHYNIVPYYLRDESGEKTTKVKMVYDQRVVAIYYDNVRIAQYMRDRTANGYTTLEEHMPPNHRWYAKWSADRFHRWAKALGESVEQVIEKVFESRRYPQQAYNTCMGVLNLEKKYGARRLNSACKRALSFGMYSYRRIENILKRGLDEDSQTEPGLENAPLPVHENVRGSDYYN